MLNYFIQLIMLTEKENKRLNKCLFHCVDVSTDISKCSSEGLALREILNEKIKGNKVIDIDFHDFSKLPCSYPVIENTFNTEETIGVLRVFVLIMDTMRRVFMKKKVFIFFCVCFGIRYFTCIKCDEVNRFIDNLAACKYGSL
ncbi:hypothetical protein Xind_03844 [Xenorhabdus indica]|nr:hypothetical protein [Xenorhabdus indica]